MKIQSLVIALAAALSLPVAAQDMTSDKGKLSYAIGYEIGRDFTEKKMAVDINTVIRALQDGASGKQPAVAEDQMREALMSWRKQMRDEAMVKLEQLARDNETKSTKFLAENKVKKGIVALANGIQYRVIEEGNGKRPVKTSEVTVHYRGSLSSGFEFISSFARGVPATFKVDTVTKGLQEVLPLMKVGDHWQIFLPPAMAYGKEGNPPVIGPNEVLVYEVKLIDVK